MLLWDTVEFAHVTLGLVPEALNAIDVIVAISEKLGMVDPKVVKVQHIQHIIASPAVGVNDAIRDHLALYDRHQRGRIRVWDNLHVNLSAPFNKPITGILPAAPRPRLPFLLPPK